MTAAIAPKTDRPSEPEFKLKKRVRFVTAASLFDGHDAAIQIMRRILQQEGAEVVHLGHDRSVNEVVNAAIEEDAQGIAISSYQGGHVEYFSYMLELLKERGASHIKVFGGGGGVIVPDEIELLHSRGVTRIFSPEDGRQMGLVGMIRFMLSECDGQRPAPLHTLPVNFASEKGSAQTLTIAQAITTLESLADSPDIVDAGAAAFRRKVREDAAQSKVPVIGITGTGGAGKSSLIDETLLRFLQGYPGKRIAVLSVDPTRRRTGGALLGDRIRMNAAKSERVYVRSMATRRAHSATSAAVKDALAILQLAQFDLVILETAGIGQSDSEVTELVDTSVYVMTPEFGAPSQLEKIDMLDFADLVVINKFDKRGAQDALRDVRKTVQRNRQHFDQAPETMPVFGTSAHRFQDPGTNAYFIELMSRIPGFDAPKLEAGDPKTDSLLPARRTRYLAEIAETVRKRRTQTHKDIEAATRLGAIASALDELSVGVPAELVPFAQAELTEGDSSAQNLKQKYNALVADLSPESLKALKEYDGLVEGFNQPEHSYQVRQKTFTVENYQQSLSEQSIVKVAMPDTKDLGERVKFMRNEGTPGRFPFTAGVFPYKRSGEDPTRMFAGEGTPERTNRRFHYVSKGQKAARLSTAFDSPTLYGADPAVRPDIYGKVGNSGVSVCSLDDAKRLYSGFNLIAPSTSISMTINGPAPTILAFYFNAAIDAECERVLKESGRWEAMDKKIDAWFKERKAERPTYRGELPENHDRMGLGFLGLSADRVMEKSEYAQIKERVLASVRGTVQADILKEDQAQNTCIFSTEFSLKMMGDVQQYFVDQNIRNFYSVSISGYHIAEAGANPITQLAFTLANGFTLVEYFRARGMDVNAFARNLSFFFSNGLDAEYLVIGRVARRIWSVAMKELYEGDERSQKLKYHIQTSGRSLHAQEIAFNDIRTTLQALYAIADNCNSLHTNAYDEAITTPTEESVRRAIAIQLVINRELGWMKNENPLQGSYFTERMTDIVEEAVLKEFESLDARGGVLGAMETMYQRGKIQDESMVYEHQKHSGELPIVGVNTYLANDASDLTPTVDLIRSSDEEKKIQVDQVASLSALYEGERDAALEELQRAAMASENVFGSLMEAVKVCTLGQISEALYEVGGAYRRSM